MAGCVAGPMAHGGLPREIKLLSGAPSSTAPVSRLIVRENTAPSPPPTAIPHCHGAVSLATATTSAGARSPSGTLAHSHTRTLALSHLGAAERRSRRHCSPNLPCARWLRAREHVDTMQQEREQAPPAYTQHHEPESLQLPSAPTHSLPSHPAQQHNGRLPPIHSLDLPDSRRERGVSLELSPKTTQAPWGALPSLHSATFPRAPEGLPRAGEADVGSPMDTASVGSLGMDDRRRRETSVLSMDDPDVRLAAEALSGLGNLDFARSPTSRSLTLGPSSPQTIASGSNPPPPTDSEPLLSLITSNHPWLGGTINGSISAYNTSKYYSPRFVKYGAELIERNIGSPVVNTVSSVGRRTGVEKNLRRYLGEQHRRPSDLEFGDTEMGRESGRKRLRITSPGAMDVDPAFDSPRTRGGSQSSYAESLPAYDDQRSPKYEESAVVAIDPVTDKEETESQSSATQDRRVNWSTQLIMTTSGLGVALSDASLRSLKICLGLLRSATKHIDAVMLALTRVLEEYEAALRSRHGSDAQDSDKMDTSTTGEDRQKEENVKIIASRIKTLSSDIWTTLQKVVESVSRYTGGALPQNASQVVRTQLLSVPQRWQLASRTAGASDGGESQTGTVEGGEEVRGANRMLAFAKEGLDMMGQITAVVDGTVQSAEAWLGRMGRKRHQDSEEETQGQVQGEKGPLWSAKYAEKN
ncbi:Opi1-domain-containing protein [Amniculicola lignicola CBS 123094]|uniref:Opi1-domain-containing protein n=1 Tax=Amniculicola lignicola CBS 123094 TaxID=1392246 RepID=A0A6A5W3Z9_9PLEO|nr:Opi1-domain-containing protein [Amniculicola lignicola CBS 123094]